MAWGVEADAGEGAQRLGQRHLHGASPTAITWAADNGAKILSLSLGGSARRPSQTAVNYAYGRAAPSSAPPATRTASASTTRPPTRTRSRSAPSRPATSARARRAATASTGGASNYGTGLDFLAPGVRIHTPTSAARAASARATTSPTSTAPPRRPRTPPGIGALVWSQNPALTNAAAPLRAPEQLRRHGHGRVRHADRLRPDERLPRGAERRRRRHAGAGHDLLGRRSRATRCPGTVWSATDANVTSGLDYWGDQSSSTGARVHGGSWSAYCADNSERLGPEVRQQHERRHDADQPDHAHRLHGASASRSGSGTRPPTAPTTLALQYWNGSAWTEQQRWYGSVSNWVNPTYTLTGVHDVQVPLPLLQQRFDHPRGSLCRRHRHRRHAAGGCARRRARRDRLGRGAVRAGAGRGGRDRAERRKRAVDRLDSRRAAAGAARVCPRATGPRAAGDLRRGRPPGRAARGRDADGRNACIRVAGRGRARGVLGRLLCPARRQRSAGCEPTARAREIVTRRASDRRPAPRRSPVGARGS